MATGPPLPGAFRINPFAGPQPSANPAAHGYGNWPTATGPAPAGAPTSLPGAFRINPFAGPRPGRIQAGPAHPTGNFGHPAAPSVPPPPLDATYYMNVARNGFNTGNQINSLNLADSQAGIALQNALGALAYQEPRDELKLEQNVNRRGALYSSVGDQQQSDLANSYQQRQVADANNYTNTHSTDQAKLAGLLGGIPLYNQGQALASTQRATATAQKNPSFGLKVPPKPKAVKMAPLHFRIR